MDGQIISSWDLQQAFQFAQQLRKLVEAKPELSGELSPLVHWLDTISWLGAER